MLTATREPGADRQLPGVAGRMAAALGDALTVADLYGDLGGPVYHRFCAEDTHEVRDVVATLRGVAGPVLELACGSGRLTLPLLAAGHRVTGVDTSRPLLDTLAARLAEPAAARLAERFTAVEADMCGYHRPGFAAVLLGTTTIGLVDPADRPALFRTVRHNLAPAGRFVLTLHVPETAEQAAAGPVETVRTVVLDDSVCTFVEHVAADRASRHTAVLTVAGGRPPLLLTSTVHLPSMPRLTAELTAAGFAVETVAPVRRPGGADPTDLLVTARSL